MQINSTEEMFYVYLFRYVALGKLLKETEPIHVRQVLLSFLRITSETKISQKIKSR